MQHVTTVYHSPCDMNAHLPAVHTYAQKGGEKAAPVPPLPVQQVQTRGRKRKLSGDLGLFTDNEGGAESMEPLMPVEKTAVYASHEAETHSDFPELRAAYLSNLMDWSPRHCEVKCMQTSSAWCACRVQSS